MSAAAYKIVLGTYILPYLSDSAIVNNHYNLGIFTFRE